MHLVHTRQQAGFSLVELMVALLLGVVLTSGVISVFITSKTSYSLNNAVGQVQEAGRMALGTMQPLVSQAGYLGCGNDVAWHAVPTSNYVTGGIETGGTDPVYSFTYPVYGFEYTNTASGNKVVGTSTPTLDSTASHWTPSPSASMLAAFTPAANSDILMLHEGLGNPANLINTGGVYADSNNLYEYASTNTPPLSAGDIAVLSSCQNVFIFQITGSSGSPPGNGTVQSSGGSGNAGNSAGGTNWTASKFTSTGGQVGQMQTYIFFVGKGVDGGYSLYEATLTADTGTASNNGQLSSTVNPSSVREIVPGVENMQVLYGVDLSGTDKTADQVPDSYQTAAQVDAGTDCTNSCWYDVVSVRIALVVRSDDDSIPKEQAPTAATGIQMLGVTYGDSVNYYPAVDRRLHRYFAETISLRNALP